MMNTCGLTQEKLDAHPTWITDVGICVALKPDGTKCNCPYSAHKSLQIPTRGAFISVFYFAYDKYHLMLLILWLLF